MKEVMIGIIGGGMRAVEACYLAHQTDCEVTVFDQDPHCAAADLADVFVCTDLRRTDVSDDLLDCDFLLPVMDEDAVLERIAACAQACGVPFLQEQPAPSAALLRAHAIPCLPQDAAPVYELLPGSAAKVAYAIQVVGDGQSCVPLLVTRILTDGENRRCRVEAGLDLPQETQAQMRRLGLAVGAALHLRGVCTVEVVRRDGQLCVSAVDMRLPAQIPSVVYQAAGINLLALLYDAARGSLTEVQPRRGYAVCEHIAVDGLQLRAASAHAMARAGRLQYAEYFFGCPEALTNFQPGRQSWVATLLAHDADSMENACARLDRARGRIAQHAAHAAYQQARPACRRAV